MSVQLASIRGDGSEEAAVVVASGVVSIADCNDAWGSEFPCGLLDLIASSRVRELQHELETSPVPAPRSAETVRFAPPYRRPGKIWGIGLNYRDHARDLDENVPQQPGSFMKPASAVIGAGDTIELPHVVTRVTAEAEVGVVIGQHCRDLSATEAEEAVLGFTPIIDMTAEDILRENPRYLTRSKSFDTFFSFGPTILLREDVADLDAVLIRTVLNGEVRAENVVRNMTVDPYELVRFHSQAMTLEPGDIISTGTPGACVIAPGDCVRCEITGFPMLENTVGRAAA
jgi:2-keto-4-pentenoate hydratase/2-oxohepta-3-ene-1,7-dioic acid hydratase in catechol pathway